MSAIEDSITILNAYQFTSLDELRTAARHSAQPVLMLVFPAQMASVSTWLADFDDVCSIDSPPELIQHRAQRLAQRNLAMPGLQGRIAT